MTTPICSSAFRMDSLSWRVRFFWLARQTMGIAAQAIAMMRRGMVRMDSAASCVAEMA